MVISPSIRTSSATFHQYEIPVTRLKSTQEIPHLETISTSIEPTIIPPLPPRFARTEQEPPLVLPRSHRDRRISPPRTKSTDKHPMQNIYQEIDSTSTDDDRTSTRNSDLQFIRGAIERVFQFNNQSTTDATSESSSHYEEVKQTNGRPYPAVEAVQRFYHHKNHSDTGKARSTKSSEYERVSSEEIDDTFNDIEEVDYQNGKFHRQSSDNRRTTQKTSQETQTIERVCQINLIQ